MSFKILICENFMIAIDFYKISVIMEKVDMFSAKR